MDVFCLIRPSFYLLDSLLQVVSTSLKFFTKQSNHALCVPISAMPFLLSPSLVTDVMHCHKGIFLCSLYEAIKSRSWWAQIGYAIMAVFYDTVLHFFLSRSKTATDLCSGLKSWSSTQKCRVLVPLHRKLVWPYQTLKRLMLICGSYEFFPTVSVTCDLLKLFTLWLIDFWHK